MASQKPSRSQISEKAAEGIRKIHQRGCPAGTACRCKPTYQAAVFSAREGKSKRRNFDSFKAAKEWRTDAGKLVRERKLKVRVPTDTVEAAGAELIAGMKSGAIRARGGRVYKPSAIRSYERVLRLRVNPALGHKRLTDVGREDVQALVEALAGKYSRSSIDNTLDPLRVLFGRARRNGHVAVDPTDDLDLPAGDAKVRESVGVADAEALVAAAPDRALWALAFYCSLRRGELRALRVSDVDEANGIVRVRRTWDDSEGEVSAKSEAGKRDVPLMGPSARLLATHLLDTGRSGDDLVFGSTASQPFDPSTIQYKADRAWKAAGLTRMTPHAMRKSGFNFLRRAGVDSFALQRVFGHGGKTDSTALYGEVLAVELETIREKAEAFLKEATS